MRENFGLCTLFVIILIIGFVFASGCFDISFGKPKVDYRVDAKVIKAHYNHTSSDSEREGTLGYGNGAKTTISTINVIFWKEVDEICLIKL